MHSDLVLEYRHLDEASSTNDFLRSYAHSADITVLSADFQTKGRGQMGNTWVSNAGENALFSLLVCPRDLKATDGFILSQAMALSIKEELEQYVGDVCIKWPNDIYVNGKKICGTLIENSLMGKNVGRSVIGSGINVNQTDFPDGLAVPPTSLRLQTGKEKPPSDLIRAVVHRFADYYTEILQGRYDRIRELYHRAMYLRGVQCRFQDEGGTFMGAISHVAPDGHIIINDNEGKERRYAFKQVKLVRSILKETTKHLQL